MSWDKYVESLMSDDTCQDAAIVGHTGESKYVWASHQGGVFAHITVSILYVPLQ